MKTLIIGPAWVGDMVMAQTLFLTLEQQHPDGVIDVMAPQWTRPLLERMPQVRQALAMPLGHGELGLGRRRRLGLELRAAGYDQAIVLPNSFKSALVPFFAAIELRTGWRGEARWGLLNDRRVLDKQRYPLMIQRFAALAYPPDAPLPESLPFPALKVAQRDLDALQHTFSLDRQRPVLALCPGAEFGYSKRWPEAYYAEVADQMIRRGSQVWIMGSAQDQACAAAITAGLEPELREHCRDFTGQTSLGEAVDLLSLAATVVSNDSGLMHIAAALGRPLVVVYGSSSPDFTPPLAPAVRILSLGLDCSPCFKRDCPLQHHRCMRDLGPSRVLEALADISRSLNQP